MGTLTPGTQQQFSRTALCLAVAQLTCVHRLAHRLAAPIPSCLHVNLFSATLCSSTSPTVSCRSLVQHPWVECGLIVLRNHVTDYRHYLSFRFANQEHYLWSIASHSHTVVVKDVHTASLGEFPLTFEDGSVFSLKNQAVELFTIGVFWVVTLNTRLLFPDVPPSCSRPPSKSGINDPAIYSNNPGDPNLLYKLQISQSSVLVELFNLSITIDLCFGGLPCLGAFAKLRKVTTSFVMSVRPHETTLLPLGGFWWNLIFGRFFSKNLSRKFKFH